MAAWGFGMPPPGFDALIAQKYAIQQQEANARSQALLASANVDNTKAGLMPTESAANVDETKARTTGLNITNQFLPDTLKANIFDTQARGQQSQAIAGNYIQQTKGLRQLQTPLLGLGLLGD